MNGKTWRGCMSWMICRTKKKGDVYIHREISTAVFLLNIVEKEVKAAVDLAGLAKSGGGSAAAYVLLQDALARLKECAALPEVQALPDRPPYSKQYPPLDWKPCEVFTSKDGAEITRYCYPAAEVETSDTATAAEGKAEIPPVKMEMKDASRRFDKALENGTI